jgi:hypothetical protein
LVRWLSIFLCLYLLTGSGIHRWRPLEAALAAVGSQSESVLDCIEDEVESGNAKPIDIDYLLENIIPPILSLSGLSLL